MNILVLGGTEFVGRHFVESAIKTGHNVVLFNRGITNPSLFPDIKTINGDRYNEIEKLKDQMFDLVLDTSGYFPENVEYISAYLKNKVTKYIFISSCSVYDHTVEGIQNYRENSLLVNHEIDPSDITDTTYGARKYLCENVIIKNFPDSHFVLRPCLIVGAHDSTYRFPYWGDRIGEGGEVLAPGEPNAPLQYIDVRDLVDFILLGIEQDYNGIFNISSLINNLSFGEFIKRVQIIINPDSTLKWIPEEFLAKNGVTEWVNMPLWLHKKSRGFMKVDSSKAIIAGLKFKNLDETINYTREWSQNSFRLGLPEQVISRGDEQRLLDKYSLFNLTY